MAEIFINIDLEQEKIKIHLGSLFLSHFHYSTIFSQGNKWTPCLLPLPVSRIKITQDAKCFMHSLWWTPEDTVDEIHHTHRFNLVYEKANTQISDIYVLDVKDRRWVSYSTEQTKWWQHYVMTNSTCICMCMCEYTYSYMCMYISMYVYYNVLTYTWKYFIWHIRQRITFVKYHLCKHCWGKSFKIYSVFKYACLCVLLQMYKWTSMESRRGYCILWT